MKAVESAGKLLNVKLEILEVRGTANLDDSILAASRKGVDAMLMLSSPVFGTNPQRIAGLTLGLGTPGSLAVFPEFARAGGLMAYGVDPVNNFRHGAALVAKVLRGAKPAELPAELPTKFELVINLKTAKSLGIVFPTSILVRADEVSRHWLILLAYIAATYAARSLLMAHGFNGSGFVYRFFPIELGLFLAGVLAHRVFAFADAHDGKSILPPRSP